MTPIYYIQFEDKNIDEGNSISTLAGIKNNFSGKKEAIVFSNHANEVKNKYAQSGIKTTIYQNNHYELIDFADVLSKLKELFVNKKEYLVVLDNDNLGDSFGSRLAALLGTIFVADAQKFSEDNQVIVDKNIGETQAFRRIPLEKKAIITIACNGVLKKENSEINIIDWKIKNKENSTYIPEENSTNDLAYAKIIVAGGKGLGSAESFKPLKKLSGKLNASVGASKAVTDQGWVNSKRMIGISNLTVSPDVYYAFGISGAVQHTIGMNKSKCIVAVNTDKSAPIFKLADYGIVGDANLVIEQLNNLL